MINIGQLIFLIEKRSEISVGDKRVDYLFHYLTGRLEGSKNKIDIETNNQIHPKQLNEDLIFNHNMIL